jgi:hypothetical protein
MTKTAWLMVITLISGSALAAPASATKKPASQPADAKPGSGSVVRIANSDDGLHFTDTGGVLIANANRPDLVRLPNDELLAIFEQPADKSKGVTLAVSRSKDDGKNWLPARPIRLNGLPEGAAISSPNLLIMPSGLVRLYFALSDKPDRAKGRGGTTICSAVTRDGVEYQVDRQVRIPCEGLASPRISVFRAEKQIVLLVTGQPDASGKPGESTSMVQQFLSNDGRTFSAPDRARFAGEIGHVVRLDQHHWRMFIVARTDIYSRMSNDGIRWRNESGACLRGGTDPAVAQLDKSKFIMLFASPLTTETAKLPQLAATLQSKDSSKDAPTASGDTGDKAQSDKQTSTPNTETAGWETFAPGGYESELGADWAGNSGTVTDSATSTADDLAPLPDFENKIDYVDWFARNGIVPDEQNAYYSYVPVLEGIPAREEKINDMFNDPVPGQVPGPWNPADHPLWEESYQATQDLMAQYAQAGRDPRPYSCPLNFGPDSDPEKRMLMGMLLPSLRDMRAAAKATMSQAWRTTDGTVPPEQMRTGLETTLGNSKHLQQGPTLIERLVGVAARNLAHQNACRALQQGVFQSAEDLEATLNVLRNTDTADPDPGGWVRMEHAAAMDVLQFVFQPKQPGEAPELGIDRLNDVSTMFRGRPLDEEEKAKLGQLTPADGIGDVQAMTEHYRQMLDHFRTKFPYEDAGHFDQEALEIGETHHVARMLVPSLARASELLRRSETSRRATQLAYSVELFKARNGRYPASLGELPGEEIQEVRTDPYSRQDFGYRLTETGPRIYTVNRNGQDDGGEHAAKWADDKEDGGSDDYVFYPPQE